MANPLRPGVKSWRFGSPPPRPMDPTTHPAYINQQTREAIVEKNRQERIKDNAEVGGVDDIFELAAIKYPDVTTDDDASRYAVDLLREKTKPGEPLSWKTVATVCQETIVDFDLRQPQFHAKTDEERHHEAYLELEAMRTGRLKPPRIDQMED